MNLPILFSFAALILFWGGSYIGIYYSLEAFTPLFAAFLRVVVALAFVLTYFSIRGFPKDLKNKVLAKKFMLIGMIAMGFAWSLLFWAETHLQPAIAAILGASVPLFVTVLSVLVLPDERQLHQLGSVFVGFLGILLIFGEEWQVSSNTVGLLAMLAVLVVSSAYGTGILLTRRWAGHGSIATNIIYQLLGAGLFLGVACLVTGSFTKPNPNWIHAIPAILYLSFFSTAVAQLLFIFLISKVGSTKASVVTFLMPLVSVLADFIFLERGLTLIQWAGASVVLVSTYLVRRGRT